MGEDHISGLKEMDPNADVGNLREAIDKMLAEGLDPAPLYIQAVARKANLEPLYKTLYRQFSNGHAHPTLTSLNMVWDNDEEGLPMGVLWGPHRGRKDELVSALVMVVVIYNQLIFEWLDKFKNPTAFDRLEEIGGRYKVFRTRGGGTIGTGLSPTVGRSGSLNGQGPTNNEEMSPLPDSWSAFWWDIERINPRNSGSFKRPTSR